MNGPSDDKAFEEYLQRGSAVSQQYRALEGEDVPAEIDAVVLARASDAVREPAAAKRKILRRWSVPVALAASTVLAISIVLDSGTRHEVALTSAPQPMSAESNARKDAQTAAPIAREAIAPDRGPAADQPRTLRSDEAPALSSEAVDDASAAAREQRAIPPRAPVRAEPDSASAPIAEASVERSAAPEIASQVDEQAKVAERQSARETPTYGASQAVAQRSVAPPPPMAPQVARDQRTEELESAAFEGRALGPAAIPEPANRRESPEVWLEYIRELRDAGQAERADREWREFRAAFPDYQVANDDRALPSR